MLVAEWLKAPSVWTEWTTPQVRILSSIKLFNRPVLSLPLRLRTRGYRRGRVGLDTFYVRLLRRDRPTNVGDMTGA